MFPECSLDIESAELRQQSSDSTVPGEGMGGGQKKRRKSRKRLSKAKRFEEGPILRRDDFFEVSFREHSGNV
jgi:hypothetical protein